MVAATAAVFSWGPTPALAAPPACPTAPTSAPSSWAANPDADALLALLTDADASCAALAARLDAVDADLATIKGTADLGSLDGDVKALGAILSGWTSSAPLQVTTADRTVQTAAAAGAPSSDVAVTNWPANQSVEFGPHAQSTIEDGAGQLDGDLWVLVGVGVGVFVGGQLLRWLWP